MKTTRIALTALLLAAGSAQAQLIEPSAPPLFRDSIPSEWPSQGMIRGAYGGMEGLPPADPKAPDHWRAEPKIFAGVELNPHLGIEAQLTNPGYREGLRFQGLGPRLAEGVPIAKGGYDFQVAGRVTVPVDEQFSVFGKLGVAVQERQLRDGRSTTIGPAASVGATYRINRKQTATAEIPLGAMARKALSGAAGGVGGAVKLGF